MSNTEFAGRVVVVTGAGSGIGREIACEFGRRGAATVVVVDRDEEGGRCSTDLVEKTGAKGAFLACDLSAGSDIKQTMEAVASAHGRFDVLVNNAAILEPNLTPDAALASLEERTWDAVFAVNLKAAWLCAKYALPALRESDAAAIVNAGSNAGIAATPMCGAYGASKAGIQSLTRSMALEFAADGVRCNCYVPAAVKTPMSEGFIEAADDREQALKMLVSSHLVPRLGEPVEVARLVCFLASPQSGFVNGASYLIDGGQFAWRGFTE